MSVRARVIALVFSILIRGTIVNRAYGTPTQNLPGTWYTFTHFHQEYLVLLLYYTRYAPAMLLVLLNSQHFYNT